MGKSIIQHKHCVNCGKVCAPEKRTCSEECESNWNKELRKRRMRMFAFLGIAVVLMAVVLVASQ